MENKNMAYWKSKNVLPAPNKFANAAMGAKTDNTMGNDLGNTEEGKGDNSSLIEALKKQDVAKQEVEKLKKDTGSANGNTNI